MAPPNEPSVTSVWSCAAPGSPTPPKRGCGPTGDLKQGAGLEHCPSGRFFANAAWLGCAVLAHNLIRWTARLGDMHPAEQLTVTRTVRTRLLELPGRLVNRSRRWVLRLPLRWPWATEFSTALDRIRSLPLLT